MTRTRMILIAIAALLLTLAATAYYYYTQFPLIIEQQARHYLKDYGVEELRYDGLRFSRELFRAERLYLAGHYQGHRYSAQLSALELRYDWRLLLAGQAQALKIAQLDIVVQQESMPAQSTPEQTQPWDAQSVNLPQLIADIPIRQIEIPQWQLDYTALNTQTVAAQGAVSLQGQLDLTLTANYQDLLLDAKLHTTGDDVLPIVQATVHDATGMVADTELILASLGGGTIDWHIAGTAQYAPLLSALASLGINSTTLGISEGMIIAGHSAVTGTLSHPSRIDPTIFQGLNLLSAVRAEITVETHLERLHLPGQLENLSADINTALRIADGTASVIFAPTAVTGMVMSNALQLPADTLAWLRWPEAVALIWQHAEPVKVTLDRDANWHVSIPSATAQLGNKDSEIKLSAIALTGKGTLDSDEMTLSLDNRIDIRAQKKAFPQMKFVLEQNGALDASTVSIALNDTAESLYFTLDGKGNLISGAGDYNTSLGSNDLAYASTVIIPLLQHFKLLSKYDKVLVNKGKVQLKSQLKTNSFDITTAQARSELSVENVGGVYDEYRFESLSLDTAWQGVTKPNTLRPIDIKLGKLDLGFELKDILLTLALPLRAQEQQPLIEIAHFSSRAFGGRLFLPEPRQWDFAADANQITLRAENWRLAELVALQQGQDIKAQGTLEGQLPVTISKGRIMIANGYLQALAPGGTIRYIASDASEALSASSKELGMALDYLSDFQYEVLRSQVELDEGGNLKLVLSLAGRNPQKYDGRGVNFNINLEQNLDPLLQTLRLSDKLVQQLQNRIH